MVPSWPCSLGMSSGIWPRARFTLPTCCSWPGFATRGGTAPWLPERGCDPKGSPLAGLRRLLPFAGAPRRLQRALLHPGSLPGWCQEKKRPRCVCALGLRRGRGRAEQRRAAALPAQGGVGDKQHGLRCPAPVRGGVPQKPPLLPCFLGCLVAPGDGCGLRDPPSEPGVPGDRDQGGGGGGLKGLGSLSLGG